MTLEATMICMDNTDWGRNGDFPPTRWESVQETVRLLFEAKLQANQESTVGLLTMAGPRIDVLATPCADDSRLLSVIQGVKLMGEKVDFVKSLEIAQLALKHRPNKNQKQRIILVLYSPLAEDTDVLTRLARKAKKNGVAIDIINIGARENLEKLQSFVDSVNNADNSHLVHVDVGVASVADVVISSPITQGAVPAGGAGEDMVQIDPNMDPELAEAIRQSLEEQKQTLQAAEAKKEEKKQVPSQPEPEPQPEDALAGLSEEEIMQRAIMLSLEGKAEDAKEGQGDAQVPAMEQTMPAGPISVPTGAKMEVKKQPGKEEMPVDLEAELLKNKDFVSELIKGLPEMSEEDKMKVISSLGQKEKKEEKKTEAKKEEESKKESMEDIKEPEKKQ